MGNVWFGKKKRSEGEMQLNPVVVEEEHFDFQRGVLRLKVRMRSGQLQELMAKVKDKEEGESSSELGGLIFQECFKERLHARLLAASLGKGSELSAFKYAKGWGLSSIQEHI